MNYATIIKALRMKLLLSQSELAKRIGVSFATVNRWENGIHKPTYKARRTIVALCQKYQVSMGDETNAK
jgi:DNA-binding transcriptional regulator YiaG